MRNYLRFNILDIITCYAKKWLTNNASVYWSSIDKLENLFHRLQNLQINKQVWKQGIHQQSYKSSYIIILFISEISIEIFKNLFQLVIQYNSRKPISNDYVYTDFSRIWNSQCVLFVLASCFSLGDINNNILAIYHAVWEPHPWKSIICCKTNWHTISVQITAL